MPELLDLPHIIQSSDFTCGPTAVSTALTFDGIPVGRWLKRLATPVVGMTAETVAAVMHHAYDGQVLVGAMDVPLLKHLTGRGRPVLCLVTDPEAGGGHWVCVRGVRRGRVYLACPTLGRISHPISTFEAFWTLADPTGGWRLDRYGVVGLPL